MLRSRSIGPGSISRLGDAAVGEFDRIGGWEGIRGALTELLSQPTETVSSTPDAVAVRGTGASRRQGELAGTPLAPGRARGVVGPPPAAAATDGSGWILVCTRLDAAHETALDAAAGVIVAVGAPSARGVRTARSKGIPVVLFADAVDHFQPGTVLSLDGDRGVVSAIGGPGPAL